MIDPLAPDADLTTTIAKLNELIGAFNERTSLREQQVQQALDSMPPGMRSRTLRQLAIRESTPEA